MKTTVRLSGFAELERELDRIGTATGQKASLRRALRKSAEPLAAKARSMAPVGETQNLAASVAVSTRLSKRQARLHRRMFRNDRAAVEMFVGPGPHPSAWNQEFGNVIHGPQAFMRPAWDSDRMALLDRLKVELWADIQRTVARAERRAGRLAARG